MKISTKGYSRKPQGKEIALLQREIEQNKSQTLSPSEIALSVIGKGLTYVLADFEGARKVENFISTSWIGIDIDSGATLEETLELCSELGLTPNVYYHTFSADLEQGIDKHRVLFQLDREIDVREFKLIQLGIMKLFPTCDKACKDGVRMWFSTHLGAEYEEGANEVSHILYLIKKHFYESTSTNKTTEIRAFAQLVGIEVINGQLALGTDLDSVKWTVTVEEAKGLSKSTTRGTTYKKSKLVNKKVQRQMSHIKLESLREYFPLLDDFFTGEKWLTYPELLCVASNLSFIAGGMKAFHEAIDAHDHYDNEVNNKTYYHVQADNFVNCYEEPKPMRFIGMFEEYSTHGKNFLTAYSAMQEPYVRVEDKTKEEDMMNLIEAEQNLSEMIQDALKNDSKVTVIQVPTGLGKSEQLIKGIKYEDHTKKAVLAFPTHELMKEMVERFYGAGEFPAHTVKRPEHLLPSEDREMYHSLLTAGDTEGAGKYFTKAMKKHKLTDDEEYQDYLLSLRSTKKALVSLTTHELALSPYLHEMGADLLIIDEDCLPTLFHGVEIKFEDMELLLSVIQTMPNHHYVSEYLQTILSQAKKDRSLQAENMIGQTGEKFNGKVHQLEVISFPVANILNKVKKLMLEGKLKFSSPILNLFNDDCFWNLNTNYNKGTLAVSDGIKLVQKPKLPDVRKIIIMSATAEREVWKFVDSDVQVYSLDKPVKNIGQISQVLDYNTSKSQLPKYEEAIVLELKQIGIEVIISHKNEKFMSQLDKQAHFGALAGLDHMKGKDMAVVGTPQLPESEYLLQVFALSGSLPKTMANRWVVMNGIKFKLFTFEAGVHQSYHLYTITSELIQAIGRARTLRTDATVILYSHVPMDVDQHLYQGQVI